MRALPLLFGLFFNWAIGQSGDFIPLPDIQLISAQPEKGLESVNLPFEMVKGIMFVEADVNEEEGSFILDTGAPELVINDPDYGNGSFLARGISGSMPAQWTTVDLFEWAGTQYWKMKAMAIDLSHLELVTDREISGIIGYSVLKNYEVFMDYENYQIRLTKPKKNSNRGQSPMIAIPFELKGHLPVIEVMVGTQKLVMGLDTGASTNLISKKLRKKIQPSCLVPLGKGVLAGLSYEAQASSAVHIRCTQIEGVDYPNMKFIFVNISHFNQGVKNGKIDGLLGFPFFNSGKFSFDYQNQILYVWEMPSSNFLVKLDENGSN